MAAADSADPYRDRRLFGDELVLDPGKTAVIVIDMLNDFCMHPGKLANESALSLCACQNSILESARETGAAVIFVNEEHRANLHPVRSFARKMNHSYSGSWGAEVVEPLSRSDADITVIKRRYSGFFQTDLDLVLRDRDIQAVVLMGVLTNICVRSTAHDAFFLGYDVVVPEDCVGAMTEFEQSVTLYDISTHFGWVTEASRVVSALISGTKIWNDRRTPQGVVVN